MTDNRVMKLWTAFVTAFLALCTALGLITTTATTAAAQTEATATSSESAHTETSAAPTTAWPMASPLAWSHARALPPTMKQRIRAEAHGKSPSCRQRPLPDAEQAEQTEDASASCDPADPADPAEPATPLQR
ncbi:DUF6344 domain-containing protein [Streptomyces sp. NBC_01275]|uniref:DUF6344 domain-containing protein n=1 Tax=Streptomyces sp. NBC_01275 TaxID=2903807 RepID=UPI00225019BD|nr:DUF6344 domain-containing protein [Streptomyces sp. NBC_01275]MCX4763448.1 DUF6344 domain-containing protein [Streptomyces sp. NBC_01275]